MAPGPGPADYKTDLQMGKKVLNSSSRTSLRKIAFGQSGFENENKDFASMSGQCLTKSKLRVNPKLLGPGPAAYKNSQNQYLKNLRKKSQNFSFGKTNRRLHFKRNEKTTKKNRLKSLELDSAPVHANLRKEIKTANTFGKRPKNFDPRNSK